jgi:hypothetical protein
MRAEQFPRNLMRKTESDNLPLVALRAVRDLKGYLERRDGHRKKIAWRTVATKTLADRDGDGKPDASYLARFVKPSPGRYGASLSPAGTPGLGPPRSPREQLDGGRPIRARGRGRPGQRHVIESRCPC